ncbi:MAG TPA: hypothetical protein VFB62_24970 [Polyangiaceae bacterium]|nr:hypothetical protein [Polyangiaceae bacterium]
MDDHIRGMDASADRDVLPWMAIDDVRNSREAADAPLPPVTVETSRTAVTSGLNVDEQIRFVPVVFRRHIELEPKIERALRRYEVELKPLLEVDGARRQHTLGGRS